MSPCILEVTSLWLAVDGVTAENGAMEVLPFTAQPESRGRNVSRRRMQAVSKRWSHFDPWKMRGYYLLNTKDQDVPKYPTYLCDFEFEALTAL